MIPEKIENQQLELDQIKELLDKYLDDNNDLVDVIKAILNSYESTKATNLALLDAINKLMQLPDIKENLVPGETPDSIINRATNIIQSSKSEVKSAKQLISLRMPDANIEEKSLYDAVKGLVERTALEHTVRKELEAHVSGISKKIFTPDDLLKVRSFLLYLRCMANDISKVAISEDGRDDVIYSLLDSVADNFKRQILNKMESKYEESDSDIRVHGDREDDLN